MKHYLKIFFILLIFFCPLFGLYAQDNPKKYKTWDGKDWDGKLFREDQKQYTVYIPKYNITVKTGLTDAREISYQTDMEKLKKSKDLYYSLGRLGEPKRSFNKSFSSQILDSRTIGVIFTGIITILFTAMCIYALFSDDDENMDNKIPSKKNDNSTNAIPQDIQEEIMACLYIVKRLDIIYTHIKNGSRSGWVWPQVEEIKTLLEDKNGFIPDAFSGLTKEILSKFKLYTAGLMLDFYDDDKFYKHLMILAEIHIISLKGHLPEIPPKKRPEVLAYIEKQKEVFANIKRKSI